MRNNQVLGLLFPNARDEALGEITAARAMGSVPFGGRYRLVDFTLSNLVNAGITKVGVITKNNYQSLMDHIGAGKAWDLSRKSTGLRYLPPYGTSDEQYAGRIASLASIDRFLEIATEEYVVMSDCYIVGSIDFEQLLRQHILTGADITVACKAGDKVDFPDQLRLTCGADGQIQDITIGGNKKSGYTGLGIYVMKRERLRQLTAEAQSRNLGNFERDVIQRHLGILKLYSYPVMEYTEVITSLSAYYRASMNLLAPGTRRQLFTPERPVLTKVRDTAPAVYGLHAAVSHSLVADGARIDGEVRNSVIFRDVHIGRGAVVENAVIMQGTVIMQGARLNCVICDKGITVRDGSSLRGAASHPVYIEKGAVV